MLEHHDELPWDVHHKDYSDLPEPVLREHWCVAVGYQQGVFTTRCAVNERSINGY